VPQLPKGSGVLIEDALWDVQDNVSSERFNPKSLQHFDELFSLFSGRPGLEELANPYKSQAFNADSGKLIKLKWITLLQFEFPPPIINSISIEHSNREYQW
jgi:hypothetical protein